MAGPTAVAGNLFDDDSVDKLRRMLAWWEAQTGGGTRPPPTNPVPPPPRDRGDGEWGCVVLTPVGGIPKMWDSVAPAYTGTGTRLNTVEGTGTGTSVGEEGDRPGFAECEVYQLEHGTPGNPGRYLERPRMVALGFTIVVYNHTNVVITGNRFCTVVRDPWGDWWVSWPGFPFKDC